MKRPSIYRTLRTTWLTAALIALAGWLAGCEESKICSQNDECAIFCQFYAGNSVYFACKENGCVCLAKEEMACTGEEGETKCTEICATFAPDKKPACNKNYCDCT